MEESYDYIIVGAGCAGLSLLMRLMDEESFAEKRVLLIDGQSPVRNDRTWCFWEKEKGYFEPLIYKKWKDLSFVDNDQPISLDLGPYYYKMIRGVDFYTACFERIQRYSNIEWWQEKVENITRVEAGYTFRLSGRTVLLKANYVFNSVLLAGDLKPGPSLVQHFKGWVIETPSIRFDPEKAILMDFSVKQRNLPAVFVYVLPLSPTQALVEYTVFSEKILREEEYDRALADYINNNLRLQAYSIIHSELGSIPMTSFRFPQYKEGVHYIGSISGQTKASTGYTFQCIQKQAAGIANALKTETLSLQRHKKLSRFDYYDGILLQVLSKQQMKGNDVFRRLFERLPAWLIFRFLDNETSFNEDIRLMNSMPWRIFIPAAIREFIRRLMRRH